MTREADNADVMAEVLTAELSANAGVLRELEDLGFKVEITERVPRCRAGRWQRVEVVGARKLRSLNGNLAGCAADDDCEVVRRTR